MPSRPTPNEIFAAELVRDYVPKTSGEVRRERLRRRALRAELTQRTVASMRGELRERGCACGGKRCDLVGKFILPWALRFFGGVCCDQVRLQRSDLGL